MGLGDRLGWLLLGCLIGFVLGYIVRYLHEIKEELDEVDHVVRKSHNEDGFVRNPIVLDVTLLLVVALTVWAAFASQKASNEVQQSQKTISRITFCNEQYLSKTIEALNERTTYSQEQANSNVALQRAQARFLTVVLTDPPVSKVQSKAALGQYFDALTKFVTVNGKADQKIENYPYPTNTELEDCLTGR
jgi:hypothetical protein